MSISSRIEGTIENWRVKWGQALKDFLVNFLSFGLELFMNIISKAAAPKLKPIIEELEKLEGIPEWLLPILKEIKEPSGEVGAMFAQSAGGALIGGAVGRVLDAFLLPIAYSANKRTRQVILGQGQLLASWMRGETTEEWLNEYLSWMGLNAFDIEKVKLLTKYVPSAPEQVNWLAKEVYEPDMIEKYGLEAEMPVYEETDFKKIGVSPEMMSNYWKAHWEHASWMQMVEMLHRGLVTEKDVYEWFRLVEIVPFWRDLLIQTAYTWPTRVDVRRWWDMRTIDETELRRLYSGMGYRGVNLDNYVLWTKVYVAFPDLMARWSKGWITLDNVRTELTALGMPAERVEEMIQMKVKPQEPERVEEGKALTKTEIYKGVKKELITWSEGIELLMDLGYAEDEADYILAINVGVLEGSPETFAEFKDLTTKYKIATGREEKPMPEELKTAAAELVKIKLEVEALERSVKEERGLLTAEEEVPDAASAKLKELQVTLNRARAELQRIQLNYNSLVAQWRHGAG